MEHVLHISAADVPGVKELKERYIRLFLCKALKLVNDTRDGPLVYVADSRRMRRTRVIWAPHVTKTQWQLKRFFAEDHRHAQGTRTRWSCSHHSGRHPNTLDGHAYWP